MGRPKKGELKREIRERNGTSYAYISTLREHGWSDSVDSVLNSLAAIAAMGKDKEWFVKNVCKKHRALFLDLGMDFPEEVRTSQSICTPEEIEELGENLLV